MSVDPEPDELAYFELSREGLEQVDAPPTIDGPNDDAVDDSADSA